MGGIVVWGSVALVALIILVLAVATDKSHCFLFRLFLAVKHGFHSLRSWPADLLV